MTELNKLERSVLEEMCFRSTDEAHALKNQIENARVLSRKNTGFGFFTYLETNYSVDLINSDTISNVFGKIEGMENPISFVLFIKRGCIHMLEGASIDDKTTEIDFSKCAFEII
jgi:hypothetical protein